VQHAQGLCSTVLSVLDAAHLLQRVDLTAALCDVMARHRELAVAMLAASVQAVMDPVAVTELSDACVLCALQHHVPWTAIVAPLDLSDIVEFPQLCVNSGAVLAMTAWAVSQRVKAPDARGVLDLLAHALSVEPREATAHHHLPLWVMVVMCGAHETPDDLPWAGEALPHLVEYLQERAADVASGLGGLLSGSTPSMPVAFRLVTAFLCCFIAHRCRDTELQKLDPMLLLPTESECSSEGLEPARLHAIHLVSAVDVPLASAARAAQSVVELAYPDLGWLALSLKQIQENFEG